MEENQVTKKRNYERYLEGQDMMPAQESSYSEPTYSAPTYEPPSFEPSYQQPVAPQSYEGLEEPVSKGEWAICYLLMMIPCVGLIMMFVWAFSSTEKKSKSNFFKVQLIFLGVVFLLYFLIFIFAMTMGIVFY